MTGIQELSQCEEKNSVPQLVRLNSLKYVWLPVSVAFDLSNSLRSIEKCCFTIRFSCMIASVCLETGLFGVNEKPMRLPSLVRCCDAKFLPYIAGSSKMYSGPEVTKKK